MPTIYVRYCIPKFVNVQQLMSRKLEDKTTILVGGLVTMYVIYVIVGLNIHQQAYNKMRGYGRAIAEALSSP